MPQPTTIRSANLLLGAQALPAEPAIAMTMLQVVNAWSGIEVNIAMMFGVMLVGQMDVSHDIFHSFRDRDLRISVFMTVAKRKLSKELCNEFTLFFESLRSVSKMRNEIAHATWVYSPEHPGYLCTLSDKDISESLIEVIRIHSQDDTNLPDRALQNALIGKPLKKYAKSDFIDSLARIGETSLISLGLTSKMLVALAERDPKLFLPLS